MMRPKLVGHAFTVTASAKLVRIIFDFRSAVRKYEIVAAAQVTEEVVGNCKRGGSQLLLLFFGRLLSNHRTFTNWILLVRDAPLVTKALHNQL